MPTKRRTTKEADQLLDGIGRHLDAQGFALVTLAGVPWSVRARVEEVHGVPQITSLRLDRATQDPAEAIVSSDALRRLPLRTIREAAWALTVEHHADVDDRVPRPVKVLEQARRSEQRHVLNDEHYNEVAATYRAALSTGAPLKAVMERFGVSRPAASKYVSGARARGLLGQPAGPGLAGDRPTPKGRKR